MEESAEEPGKHGYRKRALPAPPSDEEAHQRRSKAPTEIVEEIKYAKRCPSCGRQGNIPEICQ